MPPAGAVKETVGGLFVVDDRAVTFTFEKLAVVLVLVSCPFTARPTYAVVPSEIVSDPIVVHATPSVDE